jgi:glycogen debranching enzyme
LLDGPDAAPFRAALAERLAADDVLAGAGVRTKSTMSVRFRAGSYHNGSTWPMDTGVIADGLRRHGFVAQADDLEDRILAGCAVSGGFPEFFRGDVDGSLRVNVDTVDAVVDGAMNRLEQPPQVNQGWTATRVWRILRSRGQLQDISAAAETPGETAPSLQR